MCRRCARVYAAGAARAVHALLVTYRHGRVALAALMSLGVPGEGYMQLMPLAAPLGWHADPLLNARDWVFLL